jgi:hypothetical protein
MKYYKSALFSVNLSFFHPLWSSRNKPLHFIIMPENYYYIYSIIFLEIISKRVWCKREAAMTKKSFGRWGGYWPIEKSAISRTCREPHLADPSLSSGMHWIDPDGQGVGDDPIYVYCDMTTGTRQN